MFEQNWMNKQLAEIEAELRQLPDWMKREAGLTCLISENESAKTLTNPEKRG